MSATLVFLLTASLVALCGELVYRLMARNRDVHLLPRMLAILVAGLIVYALMPRRAEQMGSLDETAAIVLCYGAMLLGMAAEYGYSTAERASRGEAIPRFDKLTFLMPIFASPIIFIPLLTLTAELGAGGAFTRARLMVYLVAFQNGFFWKQLFEQRRQAVTTGQREPARLI